MRSRHPSLCYLCRHFVPGTDNENRRGEPICIAFPEGIPDKILNGGFDHRQQFDDETITFKRAEDVSQEEIEEWEEVVLEREKTEMLAMLEHLLAESWVEPKVDWT